MDHEYQDERPADVRKELDELRREQEEEFRAELRELRYQDFGGHYDPY